MAEWDRCDVDVSPADGGVLLDIAKYSAALSPRPIFFVAHLEREQAISVAAAILNVTQSEES